MTTPNDPRALMLAHVLDLLAIAARDLGNLREIADTLQHAEAICVGPWPDDDYRCALNLLNVDDINTSVAACLRGEHPAGSLMGRVAKMRDDAHALTSETTERAEGRIEAFNKVLDTLEGEGRGAKTAGCGT